MSGYVILRGQGPDVMLRVGPDPTPFTVPIVGGGFAMCSFSAVSPAVLAISLAVAGITVAAQPVFAGQAASAAFPVGVELAANYVSTAGTIVSVVAQVRVGLGNWTTTLTTILDPGDALAIRTQVTDSVGNVAFFPSSAGSSVTVQALPVPAVQTAPEITGNARVGATPTVTAAVWNAIPSTPLGMLREIETRLTVDTLDVQPPLAVGTQGGALRAEARARHTLGGKFGAWSAWSVSAPVTVGAAFGVSFIDPGDNTRRLRLDDTATPVSLTVGDGAFPQRNGVDVVVPSDTSAGPIFLFNGLIGVGAVVGETPSVGQTVRLIVPPLSISNAAVAAPALTYRWLANNAPISGAINPDALIVPAIAGQTLELEITATDANGPRVVRTNALVVQGASAVINGITYDAAGLVINYTGTLSVTYDAAGLIIEVT